MASYSYEDLYLFFSKREGTVVGLIEFVRPPLFLPAFGHLAVYLVAISVT